MIVIELKGGLGNQMFQYALYLKLASLGKDVKFDVTFFEKDNLKEIRLDNYFDIDIPIANHEEILKFKDVSMKFWNRVRRKIFGAYKGNCYIDTIEFVQLDILRMDNVYLSGFWQSEKYFEDIKEIVRKELKMKECLTEYQQKIREKIQNTESVSIHIRGGDYLTFADIYGGICTKDYYVSAMKEFDISKNIQYFVFSNDTEYAKSILEEDSNIVFVVPEKNNPYANMDLLLMSECKHNILANSSFSWWAGWLNVNENKKVIVPNRWINEKELNDIYCSRWIKIGEKKK